MTESFIPTPEFDTASNAVNNILSKHNDQFVKNAEFRWMSSS